MFSKKDPLAYLTEQNAKLVLARGLSLLKDYRQIKKWMQENHSDYQKVHWGDRLDFLGEYLQSKGIAKAKATWSNSMYCFLSVTTALGHDLNDIPYPWVVSFKDDAVFPE